MVRSPHLGLTTLLLASSLAPLGAQELKDAFRLLPPATTSLEVYSNPARMEQRTHRLVTRFAPDPTTRILKLLPGLDLDPAILGPGSTVVATFPSTQPRAKRQAVLIPVRSFPALVKSLKAVKASGRYTVTQGKATFTLAARGTYAVLSSDPNLVDELKADGPNLGGELTPLAPWIVSHDAVLLAPTATMDEAFKGFRSAFAPKAGSPPNALAALKILKPLVDQAAAFVAQGAVAVDFPEDGSVKGHARLFLKPGNPLGAGGTDVAGPHPLAGLPSQGFVLGGGWVVSGHLHGWMDQLAALGAEMAASSKNPELAAKAATQARDLNARIQSQSMSLGVPTKAGAPLLGQFRSRVRVDDATAYLNAWADLLETQGQAGTLPAGMTTTLKRDLLPGIPSASQTLTLGTLEGLPVPPGQLKLLFTALFGQPDSMVISMAVQDSHTVVAVLGGAAELRAALAPVDAPLDQQPSTAASDALLPGQALLRFYVAPDGVRALVQQAMETFLPAADPARKLPVLPAAPPLILTLQADAQAIEFSGAAAPESLDALAAFYHALQALTAKKP
jgi:hypothetical protein